MWAAGKKARRGAPCLGPNTSPRGGLSCMCVNVMCFGVDCLGVVGVFFMACECVCSPASRPTVCCAPELWLSGGGRSSSIGTSAHRLSARVFSSFAPVIVSPGPGGRLKRIPGDKMVPNHTPNEWPRSRAAPCVSSPARTLRVCAALWEELWEWPRRRTPVMRGPVRRGCM